MANDLFFLGTNDAKTLKALVNRPDEHRGYLLYQQSQDAGGQYFESVFGVVIEGNQPRLLAEKLNLFLAETFCVDYIGFSTHTPKKIKERGRAYAFGLAPEDRVMMLQRAIKSRRSTLQRPYRHLLVTPDVMEMYGTLRGKISRLDPPKIMSSPQLRDFDLHIDSLYDVYSHHAQRHNLKFHRLSKIS